MRRLILLFLIGPYFGMAQSSIKLNYNEVYIGQNMSIDFDYQISKALLSIGSSVYLGVNKDKVAFSRFYKNRGLPATFWQHFGLKFGLGYMIFNNKYFDLFGVYKGSLAYMNSYFRTFTIYSPLVTEPQELEDYAVVINNHEFGPVFSFDNSIGLLFKGSLTENLFLNLHVGVGFSYLRSNDVYFISPISYNGSSFLSTMFSIGFGYSFNRLKLKTMNK